MNGGIYIIAGSVDQRYPNAEKAIAEVFKTHGFKIADSLESSAVAFQFTTMMALDIARADKAAAYSALPNAGQVASGGLQLAGASMNSAGRIAGGGATGAVGFLAGALFETDSKLIITGTYAKKPIYTKGWTSRGMRSSTSDGDGWNVAKVFYKLEKGKEASDDVVLKMAIEEWIRETVIFDTPTQEVSPQVASTSVTSASPLSTAESTDQKK